MTKKPRSSWPERSETITLEKRYVRKDGAIVWVNITISPLWERGEATGRYISVVQDITERRRMEEEIREMSLRDPLTELYNRRGFITLAEQQLKAANRANRQMLLAFIDVDDLKQINDKLGHEEGDKALIDTARIIRQHLPGIGHHRPPGGGRVCRPCHRYRGLGSRRFFAASSTAHRCIQ